MAVPPMGSATWRDASYKTVQLANGLRLSPTSALSLMATSQGGVRTQDENAQMKSVRKQQPTPPPYNRDLIINTCNNYARGYMRETRSSMYMLREALWEIDRQIHRLQKDRDVIEQSHANTRRDILLNNETTQLRTSRPISERHPDKVDFLLNDEKKNLMDIKRLSERRLQEISRQLQELHSHRQKLSEFCKEKGRVLDFICEDGRPRHRELDATRSSIPRNAENADCRSAIASAHATCVKLRYAQPCNGQKSTDRRELKEIVTKGLRKKAEESSHIRGPVSNQDICIRDCLDRPLLRILQRHPATQVPESRLILQGSASLQRSLSKAAERFGDLHGTQAKLQDDQRNKLWGERLDRAAVRLRVRSAHCRSERLCL